MAKKSEKRAVLVTTAHRGVFFGYLIGAVLQDARHAGDAQAALTGILACPDGTTTFDHAGCARAALKFADAMAEERVVRSRGTTCARI